MTTLVALPYLRVSTDDKGQKPERQMQTIRPWAEREGVVLLDAVIDEGTSASKTDPFERRAFVAACDKAKSVGAAAIVVETADRFTRRGSKEDGWAEVELQRRYGLRLLRADKPLAQHGTLVGDTVDALKAEVAREWVEEHARKVRTGMARQREKGARFGRPPKPLTAAEIALVEKLRAKGEGWRVCAHAVSEHRGAFRVVERGAQKKRTVSHTHVRREIERVRKVDAEKKSQKAAE